MPQWKLNVKDFLRKNLFPFHVEQIYACDNMSIPFSKRRWNRFEVCIRLSSGTGLTEDFVDGKILKLPCPNVVWRLPGSVWGAVGQSNRDVISFCYSPDVLNAMNQLGMKVEKIAWSFAMTSELEMLIGKFSRTAFNLYTPGTPDILDCICFSLMTNLRLQDNVASPVSDAASRIRNVSIWFRTHYAEKIDIDEIARAHGFSHDHFFKTWKRFFDTTPTQFINDLRLEFAAQRLKENNSAISEIIKEVRFAGEYRFYKCFRQKYGMTPNEYRRFSLSSEL